MAKGQLTDYAALKLAANTIRDEVEEGRNTALRVGGMLSRFVEAANSDVLEIKAELTDKILVLDESTPSEEQWMFCRVGVSSGDCILVEWSCLSTGNHFSIEQGDDDLEFVALLFNDESTTQTEGKLVLVASSYIASLRIYSHDAGFACKVYKMGNKGAFEKVREEIAEVASQTAESLGAMQDDINDINGMLVNSDTLIDETTQSAEQWIIGVVNISAGDKIIITWECPTIGNWYSIERGDASLAYVETLFGENPTTAKSGRIEFVAETNIASLRIFSHDTAFTARVVKIGLNNAIDDLKSQIGVVIPRLDVKTTGLISSTTGELDTSTSWYGNNTRLQVTEGQIIKYTASPLASGYGVAFFNAGVFISGIWYDISEPETKEIVAPTGADEVALSWNRNWVPNQVVKFDNSIETLRKNVQSINERMDEEETASKFLQPYKGKRILSLGDSYTMMNYYGRWLAEITGCTQTPRGYNGQNLRHFADDTYQNTENWAQDITQPLTAAILQNYDIITIMGGTNDYGQGYAAGTIADSKDTDSVAGHLKWLLDKIYTLNPDAKIYVCTQPYRVPHPAFHNGLGGHLQNYGGATLEDCMNAIVAVCRYYSVPCFDFYHESGWNEYTNRITNPSAGAPSASNIYPPFEGNKLSVDGLHPREGAGNGSQILGYMFGKFINEH